MFNDMPLLTLNIWLPILGGLLVLWVGKLGDARARQLDQANP